MAIADDITFVQPAAIAQQLEKKNTKQTVLGILGLYKDPVMRIRTGEWPTSKQEQCDGS